MLTYLLQLEILNCFKVVKLSSIFAGMTSGKFDGAITKLGNVFNCKQCTGYFAPL